MSTALVWLSFFADNFRSRVIWICPHSACATVCRLYCLNSFWVCICFNFVLLMHDYLKYTKFLKIGAILTPLVYVIRWSIYIFTASDTECACYALCRMKVVDMSSVVCQTNDVISWSFWRVHSRYQHAVGGPVDCVMVPEQRASLVSHDDIVVRLYVINGRMVIAASFGKVIRGNSNFRNWSIRARRPIYVTWDD